MSAIVPPKQIPLVDQQTFLANAPWFEYFARLPTRVMAELAYDPPNLIASATTTQDVTVPGATLGWAADACFSLSLQGLMMTAYVKADDTVTVVLFNPTAGAINLAAGTLTAFAWQP